MHELHLFLYDKDGAEKKFVWFAAPIADEDGHNFIRNDKLRATGAESKRAFAIKEVRILTFGAGYLRIPDNMANFMRLLLAHKIVWVRSAGHGKQEIEFEVQIDAEMRWEYLRDTKSLKRKSVTLIEKDPNYYNSFEEYLKERLDLPG